MGKVEIVEMPPELSDSAETENINNVPKRQWRKWNQQSRYIFNNVYGQMAYQHAVKHPQMDNMYDDYWNTIRWNAAWLAADAAWETTRDMARGR